MKILHTSDLHLGKRINGISMLDEQKHILNKILEIAEIEQPDAIILAGDIYDKSVPSAEAITLFDDFLVKLANLQKTIFIISGNHDSAERIAFASRLLGSCNVYVSPVYNGKIEPVILNDANGEVAFYLMPFIKPSIVQHFAGEEVDLRSYNEAMKFAIEQLNVDTNRRNVLITHQFITDAERSESEDTMVGGLDNIDASVFSQFDYVALGHLHRPQACGNNAVRYSGSPLKYSFSEVKDNKSVTIINLEGQLDFKLIPLKPLHDWHDLRGSYDELTSKSYYDGKTYQEDYIRITLTDEDDIPDGMRKLQTIYHNLMEIKYDNKRTKAGFVSVSVAENQEKKTPTDLFEELYKKQNAQSLSDVQRNYIDNLINDIWNNNL